MVIIGMDPPEHREFRTIVSKAFTPRMISRLEEALRSETARVVGELRDRPSCEFVADVAARIPMWSISELMGVPPADRRRLYELSHSLIDDQDPEVAPTPETSMEAAAEIYGYASEMAARERANPSGNLTSDLLEAEVDGRKLTDMEFTLFFMFLIVAGNETTRTATSHGLLTLLDHPDSLDRLVREPSLMPTAVDEMVRWEPPIHHFRRTATTDVQLGDKTIAEGRQGADVVRRFESRPRGVRLTRTRSSSTDHPTHTCPSVSGSTSVSAPTWLGSRSGCCSPSCWRRSRTLRSMHLPDVSTPT